MIRLWQFNREQNLHIERLHMLPGCGHVVFSPDVKTLICGWLTVDMKADYRDLEAK